MRGSMSNSVKNAYPMQSGPFKNAREYVKYRQKCVGVRQIASKMFIRCDLELSKMRGSTSNSVKHAYPTQSGPIKNAREYVK